MGISKEQLIKRVSTVLVYEGAVRASQMFRAFWIGLKTLNLKRLWFRGEVLLGFGSKFFQVSVVGCWFDQVVVGLGVWGFRV